MFSAELVHINTPLNFGEVNSGKNKIIHSELHAFEKHYHQSGRSDKMVLAVVERYQINQRRFDLGKEQFLVVNEKQEHTYDYLAEGNTIQFEVDLRIKGLHFFEIIMGKSTFYKRIILE